MSKPGDKTLYEKHHVCPWCKKPIITRVVKTTIEPGVKAQTVIEGFVEKNTQTSLEDDYKESLRGEKQVDEYSPPMKKIGRPTSKAPVRKQVKRKKW